MIKINNLNFRVIGLMEEKGGSGFNDQDNLVLVPLNTSQRRLFPARRADGKMRIDLIYAQVVDSSRQEAAIVQMELALRDSHRLGPSMRRMILRCSARPRLSALSRR
jgi:hypothetical protein